MTVDPPSTPKTLAEKIHDLSIRIGVIGAIQGLCVGAIIVLIIAEITNG